MPTIHITWQTSKWLKIIVGTENRTKLNVSYSYIFCTTRFLFLEISNIKYIIINMANYNLRYDINMANYNLRYYINMANYNLRYDINMANYNLRYDINMAN
jgi:hypothetical protein